MGVAAIYEVEWRLRLGFFRDLFDRPQEAVDLLPRYHDARGHAVHVPIDLEMGHGPYIDVMRQRVYGTRQILVP